MSKFARMILLLIAAPGAVFLASCGGGAATDSSANGTTPQSEAAYDVSGSVAPTANLPNTLVYVYNASGQPCEDLNSVIGEDPISKKSVYRRYAVAEASGRFKARLSKARCVAPLLFVADVPDGNDANSSPDSPSREGRKYFSFFAGYPDDSKELVRPSITPATTAIASLIRGYLPIPGEANPKTIIYQERIDVASNKVAEAMDPAANAIDAGVGDYTTATDADSAALARLFSIVTVSVERIDSNKQSLIRFHVPTEHRPFVLVATDGQPIEQAYFDTGLGIHPSDMDVDRLKSAITEFTELKGSLRTVSDVGAALDTCYLHNGSSTANDLFDPPSQSWLPQPTAEVQNVQLLRYNTYTDLKNETLEQFNSGAGNLAFIGIDYLNGKGFKQRLFTWAIKGSQEISGCPSSGPRWRVLGNQRPVYVRTSTYAAHEITVSQQFGSRRDTFGSGTEHFIGAPDLGYTHVLVSGPGLPSDGVVFFRLDRAYLYSTNTLLLIRSSALKAEEKADGDMKWLDGLINKVQDTKAVLLTDLNIKKINDVYFDPRQTYTYRFFKTYTDLYPTLTLVDVIPKRPYLAAEMPTDYFHSVGLNIDNLIQSMQRQDPVDINWSLPMDRRGIQMIPMAVWFDRMNCISATVWPRCIQRKDQYNEYGVSFTPIDDNSQTSITLVPDPLPFPTLLTYKAYARVRLVDSLYRPLETRVGMDYTR